MAHVTIPHEGATAAYLAASGQTDFPIPFPFFSNADILVYLDGTQLLSGFSVFGVALDGGFQYGSVVFSAPPPAGSQVFVRRRIAHTRIVDYVYPSRTLDIQAVNTELDRLTAMFADQRSDLDRTLRVPPNEEPIGPIPRRAARANYLLGFGAGGDLTVYPRPNLNLLQDYLLVPAPAVQPGGVDDGARLQALIDAASLSGGGRVNLAPGSFKLGRKIQQRAGVEIVGASRFASFLVPLPSLAGDVIQMESASVLADVTLTTDGSYTRSDGAMVRMSGNAAVLEAFQMQFYHTGVVAEGTVLDVLVRARVADGLMRFPGNQLGSAAIVGQHFSNIDLTSLVVTGPAGGVQPQAGVILRNGDTAVLSDLNITRHGCGLVASPIDGEHLFALHVSNSLFDSAETTRASTETNAAQLAPAGTGRIINASFTNTWFGISSGVGLAIRAPTGKVEGVSVQGGQVMSNEGHGIAIAGAGAQNITVGGAIVSGNGSDGINVGAASSHVTLTGNRVGPMDVRGPNARDGIRVEADAGDSYAIVSNVLTGNGGIGLNDGRMAANRQVGLNVV